MMKLSQNKDDLIFEGVLHYYVDENSTYQRPIIKGTPYSIWGRDSSKVISVKLLAIESGAVLRGENKKVKCMAVGSWHFKEIFENLGTFGFGNPMKKFGELKVEKLIGYKDEL